jgi:hypothetical protein
VEIDLKLPPELAEHERVVAAVMRPGLAMTPVPVGEAQPAPATKLGGSPDLPPGEGWPVGPDGAPLPFVLQLNLTALAERFPGLLPWPARGGVVQLFTIGDDRGCAMRVHRDLGALRPAASPLEAAAEYRLDPAVIAVLPDNPGDAAPFWALTAALERDDPAAAKRLDAWMRAIDHPKVQVGGSGDWHQDVGYGEAWCRDRGHATVDDWMEAEDLQDIGAAYQRAEDEARAEHWQLVLQLLDDLGGGFYFVAPHDAAGRWDLDRMQLQYQCT